MQANLNETARNLAYQLVAECAPDELTSFTEIYADLENYGEADMAPERPHAMGGISTVLWTLLIVPLASDLVRRTMDWSVESITDWLRRRRGGKSDPKDAALAEAALRRLSDTTSTQQNTDS
jgi:hypothetical protein